MSDASFVPMDQRKADSATPDQPKTDLGEIERVAGLYRRLNVLVGLQILVYVLSMLSRGGFTQIVCTVILLGTFLGILVTAYQLAKGVAAGFPLLWAVALCIPLVNLLIFAVLGSKANAWCRARGLVVGFLGPSKASIARLREGDAS